MGVSRRIQKGGSGGGYRRGLLRWILKGGQKADMKRARGRYRMWITQKVDTQGRSGTNILSREGRM